MEPWEKVLVDFVNFSDTKHGETTCIECHQGAQDGNKDVAHSGMIVDPSANPSLVCNDCHNKQAKNIENSLHYSLQGYWTAIDTRSAPENHEALETMFGNHCSSCHTTCGDCHISQPNSVGGGFISGHVIEKTPSMTRNCTACHGSRVGNEFLGKHEGIPGDVHFRVGRMNCVSCHSGTDMHDSTEACTECHSPTEDLELVNSDTRYSGAQVPSCESCHPEVGVAEDTTSNTPSTANNCLVRYATRFLTQAAIAAMYPSARPQAIHTLVPQTPT
ncbi:MAG: hypothetical protein HC806_09080 [Anaerolineae bacterium]|nr:hypothetical protein [Anaerolineae bacterium]